MFIKKKAKKKPPEGEFYSGEIIKPLQRETKIHLLQGRSVWELHRLLTTIHPHWNNFFFLIRYVRWRCGGLGKREGGVTTHRVGEGGHNFSPSRPRLTEPKVGKDEEAQSF